MVVVVVVAVGVGVVVVVVDVVVVVAVAVARCFVGTHARRARARAPNRPANTDSFGARARARRAPAHIRKGGSGAHKRTKKPWYLRCFCSKREDKIEDKDSEKNKNTVFYDVFGPPGAKTRVQKSPKTSLFTVFWTPTEEKTALRAMFSHSRNPKMKPKQRYSRCFCNSEKGVFAECRKTKSNIRMAKIQKRCILRCFFSFRCEKFCFEKRSKHRNLQCFLLPPKTKQRYLRCFPSLASPK